MKEKLIANVVSVLAWAAVLGIAVLAIWCFMKFGVDPNHVYFSL